MIPTLLLLVCLANVHAWLSPVTHTSRAIPSCHCISRSNRFTLRSSTDEEESSSIEQASFDDAGQKILEEENEELAANMGQDEDDQDFEQMVQEYDAIREAIRARTAEMGIEKSVVTAKLIEEANARAKAGQAVSGLDLSQVTGAGFESLSSQGDEGLPTFADDLEAEFNKLPEEQRKAIDPTDGMNWIEASLYELQFVEWPTPMMALKEVGLVLLTIAFMAVVIINFDHFLREKFTDLGFIPSPDSVNQQLEGLALPEGWTEGLTDQDVVNVPLDSTNGPSDL